MSWTVVLSCQAIKDIKKIKQAGLSITAKELLKAIESDPFTNPPRYEALVGNLKGFYSRRINIKHRLVYSVDIDRHLVHVLRMWTHYE
ncbi:MAG: Txe/YoeB family addiction module toxin [Proteobacteria bacterium]|nr:Txe/YoeB family addiction module toxin [Pseudomonadota bacterium]MBU1716003.1 Txe/YoeB family addiction module toxin [Pseudomonadota bacterium]